MTHAAAGDSAHLWDGRYKIPWDDPGFSQRMLAEHLTQDHDLASRRSAMIEAQVRWIHEHVCGARACRILDIACGPGLYSARLGALGHRCRGIDFGPASIAYAQEQNPPNCTFDLGDIRTVDFGAGYDVAMFIYGEFNVFPPEELRGILHRVRRALSPGGRFLVEVQADAAVRRSGTAPDVAYEAATGLFSERPHRVTIENAWHEDCAVAQQRFEVTDVATGKVARYRSTTKAWRDDEIVELLLEAGFSSARTAPDWPVPNADLQLFLAE
jgi:SAM-dependent methyltransferase